MKKLLLTLALLLFAGNANAGVMKLGAKLVKKAAVVASYPVRHPVKTLKGVGRAAW